jgi:hypothetical protein
MNQNEIIKMTFFAVKLKRERENENVSLESQEYYMQLLTARAREEGKRLLYIFAMIAKTELTSSFTN